MSNLENNLKSPNIISEKIIPNQEDNFNVQAKKNTEELNYLTTQLKMDNAIDDYDLSPSELIDSKQEFNEIKEEIEEVLNDQHETSEAINNNDFELIKESWRKSAEEQFGITDFNLEVFKRQILDQNKVAEAFNSGKDWDYIYDDKNINKFIEGDSYDQAIKVFEAMQSLEEEMPGCIKNLHEKFGITNFHRYPKDILLNQANESDPEKEVGLMVFARNDYNGAFDNQNQIWDKIYGQQKDSLNFRIVECSSDVSFVNQLDKIKEDFNKKIALFILSAHSFPDGFYFAGEDDEGSFLSKDELNNLVPKMKDIFSENSQIVGNACSSGSIDGWVKDLSKEIKIKAVGPDRPAAIQDIDFVDKEIVPKYYDNDIYSGYHNGFLLSKKRENNI